MLLREMQLMPNCCLTDNAIHLYRYHNFVARGAKRQVALDGAVSLLRDAHGMVWSRNGRIGGPSDTICIAKKRYEEAYQ